MSDPITMASVKKVGKKFKVVHSITGVPVGTPNTFSTRSKAQSRASQVKCDVLKKCPKKRK